ncbi:MAG: EamA family transporter [Candidatus Nanohaloarchaea archaeon]
MTSWAIFAVITLVTWGLYDFLFKIAENHINTFLAVLIISGVQAAVVAPFFLNQYVSGSLAVSSKGLLLSGIMGVLVAIGTVSFFYAFQSGAPTSLATPAVLIGSFLIVAVLGISYLGEPFTVKKGVGLILGIISVLLLTNAV